MGNVKLLFIQNQNKDLQERPATAMHDFSLFNANEFACPSRQIRNETLPRSSIALNCIKLKYLSAALKASLKTKQVGTENRGNNLKFKITLETRTH